MGDETILIPDTHYALFNTSKGNDPAFVTVNSSARLFKQKEAFPWHLSIIISCEMIADKGMPTPAENTLLNPLEDPLFEKLLIGQNAIFLSRVTYREV